MRSTLFKNFLNISNVVGRPFRRACFRVRLNQGDSDTDSVLIFWNIDLFTEKKQKHIFIGGKLEESVTFLGLMDGGTYLGHNMTIVKKPTNHFKNEKTSALQGITSKFQNESLINLQQLQKLN